MKYFEPNIIIVDDHQEEIQDILDYYKNSGIGCKLLNPDYVDGDDMPENHFSDVNIIYLDLYYSGKFDAEQCSNWVRSIVDEKTFYVLVLWTKDISKAAEVIELLTHHNRKPFLCIEKNKTEYPSKTEGKKYEFEQLIQEINQIIETNNALEEIFNWKNNLKISSNNVISNITKDPSQINDKLKKIIMSHGGKSIIESENALRKRVILFEALDTILISNTRKNINQQINVATIEKIYNLKEIQHPFIDKELNSWFHFKLEKQINNEFIIPGLIAEFKDNDWKEMYSIHNDKNVMEYVSKQVGDNVQISSIALLLTRPCDIAQNKYGKNLKLISGLKISNPIRKNNVKMEFQKGSSDIDSVKLYDHLYFSEKENDVTLLFDFRYNFSVPEKIFIEQFDKIKIFNKELLSEMQVEYSSYSSRLGITQII
jgi:hypothetical protein